MNGHFAFSFDSSESIRLVVIAKPTVWLYNRLMPNQSIASMPPIAGQCRYPLKILYTVEVALQGKNAIHDKEIILRSRVVDIFGYEDRFNRAYDNFTHNLNRRSILSSSKSILFTRV